MRLTDEERRAIREAVAEIYGPTAVVRLFGSRVRDDVRGGDIDLHVETDEAADERFPSRVVRLAVRLEEPLDEAKIDIIETIRGRPLRAIEQIAYRDGLEV